MHMELDNIINELDQRVTRKDSSNMRKVNNERYNTHILSVFLLLVQGYTPR